ncbi:MAG: hypothetical protein A4E30_00759 [Methanomassiliicoccales archaeon PtaB.Bin215]|nr:MAG: hypothetical protein A4E30_00759 [Methanomassiliicoccales archaeon PtaB.Bin215]
MTGAIVTGVEQVKARADALGGNIQKATGEGLYKWSNVMMGHSHDESPYQTRDMIRTGKVNSPTYTRNAVSVRSGYNIVYARRQHEEMSYRHPHGKAKFLIDPFLRDKPKINPTVQETIQDLIRSVCK